MAKTSAAYGRRNERARALGYRNYYDYRIHLAGEIPPDEPVSRETRDIQRGHRSLQDLVNVLSSGRVNSITPTGGQRNEAGQYETINFTITTRDGRTATYRLKPRQTTQHNLLRLRDIIEAQGIDYLPDPSLDVFGRQLYLIPGDNRDDEYEEIGETEAA